MSDRDRDPRAAPRVAIIARQGKFLVAEPFFGDGPRLASAATSGTTWATWSSCPVRQVADFWIRFRGSSSARKGGSRRPRVLRRLGRPDVARDVISR